MVIRSLEAGKSIIPDSANRASGKTSVCSTRAAIASRSAGGARHGRGLRGERAVAVDAALGEHQNEMAPKTSRIAR